MLKLHYAPKTISIAVIVALYEADVPFEMIEVDFATAAQTKPDYHKINPKGRVPALETPDGILTETGAILEYAAPSLFPTDPFKAAKTRELMYYLASTMHVAHAHKMRGSRWANEESSFADMKAKVPETVGACAAYLEDTLTLSPFALGGTFSVADAYLFRVLSWLEGDGVDINKTPKLAQYFAMLDARPSVAKARAQGIF